LLLTLFDIFIVILTACEYRLHKMRRAARTVTSPEGQRQA
jgi:uncharacterized membrane protein